jgi:hypothetical protein
MAAASCRDWHAAIDIRHENPFYVAEDAGSADLVAGGRLQYGISRGSPEQVAGDISAMGHAIQTAVIGPANADTGRILNGKFIGLADDTRSEPRGR